ncbi:MAG TPA: helix-turn-helix transcriptional regulator [Firmicutes bacterium]|nr:helix-turn-helix transcriptional regulator [Bacillota bacterium]
MSYYPHIRDMREDNDMTQSDIAKLLYISQQQYSLYEKGYRDIPTAALIKLADFYRTSTDFLLGRTNNPAPPQE